MPAQLGIQNDRTRRNHAAGQGFHDHLLRTAEARRRQAQAIAQGVSWLWTKVRRSLPRLLDRDSRGQTPAANRNLTPRGLGRAGVAPALGRDLAGLARLARRFILEPLARRRRRRIAIEQLRSLDDHLLADIGLTRGQIEPAVDGMLARRDKPWRRSVGPAVRADEARDELPLAA
jgi:uncharacterized protein YjiS (DUF1127 family)